MLSGINLVKTVKILEIGLYRAKRKIMTWRKIKQNTNYSINENGQIRNDLTGKIKAPYTNKSTGYLEVDLWNNNKRKKYSVHRLLAEAFIENSNDKPCIDHKDGNRQNNDLSNLRWATYSENNSRFNTLGVRSERVKVTHYKEKRNKRGGGHIAWLEADNEMCFDRIVDVAEYFDVTQGNITPLLKSGEIGRRGKMRGYKFEYFRSITNV